MTAPWPIIGDLHGARQVIAATQHSIIGISVADGTVAGVVDRELSG